MVAISGYEKRIEDPIAVTQINKPVHSLGRVHGNGGREGIKRQHVSHASLNLFGCRRYNLSLRVSTDAAMPSLSGDPGLYVRPPSARSETAATPPDDDVRER